MEATISAPNEIPTAIEEDMFKHLQSGTLQSSTQVDDETVNGIDINSPSQTHGETTDTTESIDELSSPHNSDGAMGRKKEWEVIKSIGASFKSVLRIPEQMLKAEPRPWQYVTRRIENDEAYLLGLMREKGVSYRSAPQSMSASLRATLFTILSLWIPLAPLFWLMYKQFSSSNSSAQRKHLGSIAVKFKDVAGVDEAKAELVEVLPSFSSLGGSFIGAFAPFYILLVLFLIV
jgi:ATP-dependent Zn protease